MRASRASGSSTRWVATPSEMRVRRALGRLVRSRWFRVAVVLAVVVVAYSQIRKAFLLPKPPRPDAATFAQAGRVRIFRDRYGVPHVYEIGRAHV